MPNHNFLTVAAVHRHAKSHPLARGLCKLECSCVGGESWCQAVTRDGQPCGPGYWVGDPSCEETPDSLQDTIIAPGPWTTTPGLGET